MSDKLLGLSGTVSPNFLAVIFLNFGPELHACEVAERCAAWFSYLFVAVSRWFLAEWTIDLICVVVHKSDGR